MAVVADSRAECLPCADAAKHKTKANHWIVMHHLVLDGPRHTPLHPSGKRILFDDAGEDSVKGFYVVRGLDEMEAFAPSRLSAYFSTRGGGGGDLIGILTHT